MRIIDTENKILTGDNHPQLKIGNKLYVVDDRKSTFDKIQKIQGDASKTEQEKEQALFELSLGKKEAKELLDMDLTVEGYQNLVFYIMSAIVGKDFEEFKAEMGKN